jgi:FKBP12-rapamycin complex-associated protein
VRTLVLNPEDDPVMWIKFANLCRKNDRMPLAEKTINSLLSPERVSFLVMLSVSMLIGPQYRLHDHHTKAPPNVVYAHLKYMWAQGSKEESLEFLRRFSEELSHDLGQEAGENSHQRFGTPISKQKLTELSKLLARCYYKQGEWQAQLGENWGTVGFYVFLL